MVGIEAQRDQGRLAGLVAAAEVADAQCHAGEISSDSSEPVSYRRGRDGVAIAFRLCHGDDGVHDGDRIAIRIRVLNRTHIVLGGVRPGASPELGMRRGPPIRCLPVAARRTLASRRDQW